MSEARKKQAPFGVRLPDGLRDKLKHSAAQNRRSMNAELIVHLEAALANQAAPAPPSRPDNAAAISG
ncbi:MAG: Arc family DNA-binding protein [Bosea sp. (in: a-proteobacteria)]|nr:Arc family DNA-binding protein [Bosea sp. (in: a-proteobacteria)]